MQSKLGGQKEYKKEDGKPHDSIPVSLRGGRHDEIIVLNRIRKRDQTSAMGSVPVSMMCETQDETSRLYLSSRESYCVRKKQGQQLRLHSV